jgi:hypothetical protein
MPGHALPALIVSETERRDLEQFGEATEYAPTTGVASEDYSPC